MDTSLTFSSSSRVLRFTSGLPLSLFNFHFIISIFRLLSVQFCCCCCFYFVLFCFIFFAAELSFDWTDAAINHGREIVIIIIWRLNDHQKLERYCLKDIKICWLHSATITEWWGQKTIFIIKTCWNKMFHLHLEFLSAREKNADRRFMGYCKDMIIIVCLHAFTPPLNILFKGAQQTPGDVFKIKWFWRE